MSGSGNILAIDQGTTSSRAILFTASGKSLSFSQTDLLQHYPQSGWVEHDPEQIWQATLATMQDALSGQQADGIGITNQRETVVVWERATGKPIYPAIVWQDRRTAQACRDFQDTGLEGEVQNKTGLLLDPYFSATKIAWILDYVEGAREKADRGELAAGTIDTFLIWRLTKGQVHATDATNASRTLLFHLEKQEWDKSLLELFRIPPSLLPEVQDSGSYFGEVHQSFSGKEIPILAVLGDQQAALFGQACFKEGMMKSTYGTGCFTLLHTGNQAIPSKHRLLTTAACRRQGRTTFALEGSIFNAGTAVQWLRDKACMIQHANETEALASQADDRQQVHFVPAFTGLGAPWWDPDARGAILGISRDTGIAEITRAALEAVCFQTRDLLGATAADGGPAAKTLRVDGGMMVNDWLAQRLADLLGVVVERPQTTETTALGVAQLAMLESGIHKTELDLAKQWSCQKRFLPNMSQDQRDDRFQAWQDAVRRVRS